MNATNTFCFLMFFFFGLKYNKLTSNLFNYHSYYVSTVKNIIFKINILVLIMFYVYYSSQYSIYRRN